MAVRSTACQCALVAGELDVQHCGTYDVLQDSPLESQSGMAHGHRDNEGVDTLDNQVWAGKASLRKVDAAASAEDDVEAVEVHGASEGSSGS